MLSERVCGLWSGLAAESASRSPGSRSWKRQVPGAGGTDWKEKKGNQNITRHLPGRTGVRPVV